MSHYLFPESTSEALALLKTRQGKGRVLAGGTDLMPAMQAGQIKAEYLIDITRIKELGEIRVERDFVTIGAAVPFAVIKEHPFLQSHVSTLVQAAASIGAGGIQQSATLAGNIIQAMPAGDGTIAALALESEALLCGEREESWIPVRDLYLAPGKSAIDPTQELIKTIRFPLPPSGMIWGTAWARIGRRAALVLPILNCAVKLLFERTAAETRITKAVIALGPAGEVPLVANDAAEYLVGKIPDLEIFNKAAELTCQEARPRSNPLRASREYRLKILPNLVRNTLFDAHQGRTAIENYK